MSRLFIPKDYWEQIVPNYISESKVNDILQYYDNEYGKGGLTPAKNDVFKALELTSFKDVRVVILGQDPYPDLKNAMGLAFSSKSEIRPLSLGNIIKEVENEYSCSKGFHGNDLSYWANQGVLLLNAILTFKKSDKKSENNFYKRNGKRWEDITDAIICSLDDYSEKKKVPIVFMLWGEDACFTACRTLLLKSNKYRLVLTATHPSNKSKSKDRDFAKKFEGCGHFRKANAFLAKNKVNEIDWGIYTY